jgi:HEAT repeat protein
MTKRSIYRLAIVVFCLALAVGYFFFGDALIGLVQREPFYGGKRASYWVKSLDNNDEAIRKSAAQALDQVGPEWWFRALKDDDIRIKSRAKQYLLRSGAELTPVVPVYIAALNDDDPKLRHWAVMSLWGGAGPEAKEVIPKLIETLKDEDKTIANWAALDLGKFGADAKAAVPAMIEAVEDPSLGADRHQVDRSYAITALRDIGPEAKAAVPSLKKTLNDPDKYVADNARSALERIDPQPAKQESSPPRPSG